MPSSCKFEYDHDQPIYYSGETVHVVAILTTTSDKCIKDICITLLGEGKVCWDEQRVHQRHYGVAKYENYLGREIYINDSATVFRENVLPHGTHEFPCTFNLPEQCPTSCYEKYGHITYETRLVVNRIKCSNMIFKSFVTVIKPYNLNNYPELLFPVQSEDIKFFCCWPCASEPVLITLYIPYGGYAPGQNIHFALQIDNQSQGYDLQGIKAKLIQSYKFEAGIPEHKVRFKQNTLAKIYETHCCLRLSKKIIKTSIAIPAIPPTSSDAIVSVNYSLQVTILSGGCHKNSNISVPITIGTVPLTRSITHPYAMLPSSRHLYPSTLQIDPVFETPSQYNICSPPSYEEALRTSTTCLNNGHNLENDVAAFVPKYPVFRCQQQTIASHESSPN